MKILHITTFKSGGAGTAAWSLHQAMLSHKGIESRFLSFEQMGYPKQNWFTYSGNECDLIWRLRVKLNMLIHQKDSKNNFTKEEIKKETKAEYISLPFTAFRIHEHPLVNWADVLHLHWVSPVLDYSSFFKKNRKPVAWTMHDLNPVMGMVHYEEDRRKFGLDTYESEITELKIKAYKHATCNIKWIMPSRYFAEFACGAGLSLKDITYIPYVAPLDVFKPMEKIKLRAKLIPDAKHPILLMAATHLKNKRKGADILIDALSKIKENYTLISVGAPPPKDEIIPGAYYTGFINDRTTLAEWFALADAVVIPSREDNLPNVLLEALSCGTPVIGFRVGGLIDHIHDGVTGLLAAQLDADHLAEKINAFLHAPHMFRQDTIRQYALGHFRGEKIVSAHIALYQGIAGARF
jgi:glycosyltransferase involved in cell wall biosynthesis